MEKDLEQKHPLALERTMEIWNYSLSSCSSVSVLWDSSYTFFFPFFMVVSLYRATHVMYRKHSLVWVGDIWWKPNSLWVFTHGFKSWSIHDETVASKFFWVKPHFCLNMNRNFRIWTIISYSDRNHILNIWFLGLIMSVFFPHDFDHLVLNLLYGEVTWVLGAKVFVSSWIENVI